MLDMFHPVRLWTRRSTDQNQKHQKLLKITVLCIINVSTTMYAISSDSSNCTFRILKTILPMVAYCVVVHHQCLYDHVWNNVIFVLDSVLFSSYVILTKCLMIMPAADFNCWVYRRTSCMHFAGRDGNELTSEGIWLNFHFHCSFFAAFAFSPCGLWPVAC